MEPLSAGRLGQCATTLLAGRDQHPGPRLLGLLDAALGHGRRQFGIGHFGVPAPAAAEGHLPVVGHLAELHAGQSLDDLSRGVIDTAGAAQVAGVVVRHWLGEGVQLDPAGGDQVGQKLGRMQDLEAQRLGQQTRILVGPHVIAGGAGGHQPPGADGPYRFHVVSDHFGQQMPQAGDLQGKATAPFLTGQRGDRFARPPQDLDKALRDAIDAGVKGRHTAHKVDGFGTRLTGQPLWHSLHVLRPDQPPGIVLASDVVLSQNALPQQVKSFGVKAPGHQLLAQGDPQRTGIDLDGADGLAAGAEGALVDAPAVGCQLCVARRREAKEPRQGGQVTHLPQPLGLVDFAQRVYLFAPRHGKGGAVLDALAAAGARFHLDHLAQREMRQVHLSFGLREPRSCNPSLFWTGEATLPLSRHQISRQSVVCGDDRAGKDVEKAAEGQEEQQSADDEEMQPKGQTVQPGPEGGRQMERAQQHRRSVAGEPPARVPHIVERRRQPVQREHGRRRGKDACRRRVIGQQAQGLGWKAAQGDKDQQPEDQPVGRGGAQLGLGADIVAVEDQQHAAQGQQSQALVQQGHPPYVGLVEVSQEGDRGHLFGAQAQEGQDLDDKAGQDGECTQQEPGAQDRQMHAPPPQVEAIQPPVEQAVLE